MPSQTTQAAHSAPASSPEGLALTTTTTSIPGFNKANTPKAHTQKPGAAFDTLASIVSGAPYGARAVGNAQTDRLRAALIEALS